MPLKNEIHLATSEDLGATPAADGLWAGDTPSPATRDVSITVASTALVQYQPLQRNASTQAYEPWAAGAEIAAVTCYGVPIGTSRAAVYTAGMFNIDAIAWPASTTEAQVQAGARGQCQFRKLLWSDKRTGTEPAPGTPAGP